MDDVTGGKAEGIRHGPSKDWKTRGEMNEGHQQ